MSISGTQPLIIVSDRAPAIFPFSMRKLFFATPENSPLGAGCPPELMRRAAQPDEMNMRGIVSVYGETESAPGDTMSELDDPLDERCETVGRAFPHVECKIIDPETGADCPDGVNG